MKTTIIYITTLFLLIANSVNAQNKFHTIDLTNPTKTGTLKINVTNASIKVIGHKKNNVELSILDNRRGKDKAFGTIDLFYKITESDNKVQIINRDKLPNREVKGITLELKVPEQFALNLKTHYGNIIKVDNVKGNIEVKGYYTDVNINDVEKNILASTNIGKMNVVYKKFSKKASHIISSYKGNLDVFLPKDVKATILIDNYFGKFKSDFELKLDTKNTNDDFVRRKINGGGTELQLVNYFKDIIIHAK